MFLDKNTNNLYIIAVPIGLLSGAAAIITTAYLTKGKKQQALYNHTYDNTKNACLQEKINNLMYNFNVYFFHEHLKVQQTSNSKTTLPKSLSSGCLDFLLEFSKEAVSTFTGEILAGTLVDFVVPGLGGLTPGLESVTPVVKAGAEYFFGEAITEATNKACEYAGNGVKQVAEVTAETTKNLFINKRNSTDLKPNKNTDPLLSSKDKATMLEKEGKLSLIFGENFQAPSNSVRPIPYDHASINPFKVGLINAIQNFILSFFIKNIQKKATSDAETQFTTHTKEEAQNIYTQIVTGTHFQDVEYNQVAQTIGVEILTNKLYHS